MAEVNWWVLVLTSTAIGAGVAAAITALSTYVVTKKQTESKKMEIAFKLFEAKQAQVKHAAERTAERTPNVDVTVTLSDPAFSLLGYMKAVDEIQKKRSLKKWITEYPPADTE